MQLFRRLTALALTAGFLFGLWGCEEEREDPSVCRDEAAVIAYLSAVGEERNATSLSQLFPIQKQCWQGRHYYRMGQSYGGYPVYGRSVVCVTDAEGKVLRTTGNVVQISDSLSLQPAYTWEQAVQRVSVHLEQTFHLQGYTDLSCAPLCEERLMVYADPKGQAHLVYGIGGTYCGDYVLPYTLLVDAHSGEVLTCSATVSEETATGYTAGDTEQTHGFPVEKLGQQVYLLNDPTRNIYVRTLQQRASSVTDPEGNRVFMDRYSRSFVSDNNIFGDGAEAALFYEDGAVLLQNISRIHDLLQERFSFDTANGKLYLFLRDGYQKGCNARGGKMADGSGAIFTGYVTGVSDMDVLAHEYGHVVSHTLVNWSGHDMENLAINEACSDLFGCLYEMYAYGWEAPDWEMEGDQIPAFRNLWDPEQSGHCSTIQEVARNAEAGCYDFSLPLSHAFYLMSIGINFDGEKMLSAQELMELWYGTLLLLPSDCGFAEFRHYTELAAEYLDLTQVQKRCIAQAFEEVGLSVTVLSPGAKLIVCGADGKAYPNFSCQISGIPEDSPTGRYSRSHVVNSTEPLSLELRPGTYTLRILNNEGAQDPQVYTVQIRQNSSHDELKVYTDYAPRPTQVPVRTARQESLSSAWGPSTYALPEILLEGEEIAQFNEHLRGEFESLLAEEGRQIQTYGNSQYHRVNYFYGQREDLLSLVIVREWSQWDLADYSVYQFSLSQGTAAEARAVWALYGYDEAAYLEQARIALGAAWWEYAASILESQGWSDWSVEEGNRLLSQTLRPENVAAAHPYVGEDGKLWIVGTIYTFAGAGYLESTFPVSDAPRPAGVWEQVIPPNSP